MGWSKIINADWTETGCFWGDIPQDAVDDYLEEKYPRDSDDYLFKTKEQRLLIQNECVEDPQLKEILDAIFLKEFNRPARTLEIEVHLDTALGFVYA